MNTTVEQFYSKATQLFGSDGGAEIDKYDSFSQFMKDKFNGAYSDHAYLKRHFTLLKRVRAEGGTEFRYSPKDVLLS